MSSVTVIQRLERIGLVIHTGQTGKEEMFSFGMPAGIAVHLRPGNCGKCGEPVMYCLLEPALRYVQMVRCFMFLPQELCDFCNLCSWFVRSNDSARSSLLGSKLPKKGQLFDVIDKVEFTEFDIRNEDDPRVLEELEGELESRLSDIRSKKEELRIKLAKGDPFRGGS